MPIPLRGFIPRLAKNLLLTLNHSTRCNHFLTRRLLRAPAITEGCLVNGRCVSSASRTFACCINHGGPIHEGLTYRQNGWGSPFSFQGSVPRSVPPAPTLSGGPAVMPWLQGLSSFGHKRASKLQLRISEMNLREKGGYSVTTKP